MSASTTWSIKSLVLSEKLTPLYTHPPVREWKGLTEEEILSLYGKDLNYRDGSYERYARAIEAKLKEKNNG